uniref:Ovule protein n=1 Tax=Angiostrongylus cantonensis TaxID=6313 RepID=A0A0K0D2G7_ANGCA
MNVVTTASVDCRYFNYCRMDCCVVYRAVLVLYGNGTVGWCYFDRALFHALITGLAMALKMTKSPRNPILPLEFVL